MNDTKLVEDRRDIARAARHIRQTEQRWGIERASTRRLVREFIAASVQMSWTQVQARVRATGRL